MRFWYESCTILWKELFIRIELHLTGIASQDDILMTTVYGNSEKPLRIYTLGRFSIASHGEPLQHARKLPQKPLLLLKAVIASGGRQVGNGYLISLMWPDKEGDLAQQAFDTTLHRLRKYLGDDRYLVVEDGCVTLNSELIWVDVWSFEKFLGDIRGYIRKCTVNEELVEIERLAQSLLAIYQGHFLAREEVTYWSVSIRERLRSKYIHSLVELGHFWEKHGFWDNAILTYRKGIELDDLVETFYQRLMICLIKKGRKPEAIAVYRQCGRLLSVVLGLEPMDETREIYQSILSNYRTAV